MVPVKTASNGAFRFEARNGSNGALMWSATTDYVVPPHNWFPSFNLTLSGTGRVYAPGAGGKLFFRDDVDSSTGAVRTVVFYGEAIYAANSGTVDYAGPNDGYGNYIRIQHGGGVGTGYAHIRDGGILVRSGQWVNSGQLIAYAGNTGRSFGCHLHFEVYVGGRPVNPVAFLGDRGVPA